MLNPVCTVPILSWNKKDGQSSKFGKEIEDNFWITVGTPDRYSGRYIGGESVISRWCIGQLSVVYRSAVGRMSVLSIDQVCSFSSSMAFFLSDDVIN